MPAFPAPGYSYRYRLTSQLRALQRYRETKPGREIPQKAPDRLLFCTWNIANLGLQKRNSNDYRLLAEILSWFDFSAVQEVNDNLSGLMALMAALPANYRVVYSNAAGNQERLAYIYDADKIEPGPKAGHVTVPPSQIRHLTIAGSTQKFRGFDRSPYLALFTAGRLDLLFVNVHLYHGGSDSGVALNRRKLETLAVARWADLRRRSKNAATRHIVPLGDFNLPKPRTGGSDQPVFDQLTQRGLHLPGHTTRCGSSIATDNRYDQIAFFPGETGDHFTGKLGVFDFDGAVFSTLYQTRGLADFLAYVRYHLSDHRPMWAQFEV